MTDKTGRRTGIQELRKRPRRKGPGAGAGHRRKLPRAKKRFSQNFLVDKNIAGKIVDLSQIGADDTVVEIGPGTGALTAGLLQRAAAVHAVELDEELYQGLRGDYGADPGLTLHLGDILNIRIRDLVPEGKVVVVGNLPYAITSDLVLWLLDQRDAIRRAVVLMQREVAERLTAEPGAREGGSLTLAIRYWAEAERIFEVSPGCFRPIPKVHSSLVAFRFLDSPRVAPRDEAFFFRVIRAAFGERRKTVANALSTGLGVPRTVVETTLGGLELDPKIRGERLSLEQFCALADRLLPEMPTSKDEAGRG